MEEIGTIEQKRTPFVQPPKLKNFLGGESCVVIKTLRTTLDESEKSELLRLMDKVQSKTAQIILDELCSDSGAMRRNAKNHSMMVVKPEEIIVGLSDAETDWIAGIFTRLYIAKDLKKMSGFTAFEYMKKYYQNANIVAFTTLMKRVLVSPEYVDIAEVIRFVELNAPFANIDEKSIQIYHYFLKRLRQNNVG